MESADSYTFQASCEYFIRIRCLIVGCLGKISGKQLRLSATSKINENDIACRYLYSVPILHHGATHLLAASSDFCGGGPCDAVPPSLAICKKVRNEEL